MLRHIFARAKPFLRWRIRTPLRTQTSSTEQSDALLDAARQALPPAKVDTVIFHFPCVDGFGAAWAAWKFLGYNEIKYIPGNYTQPLPDLTGRKVLMVDMAYDRATISRLRKDAHTLIIIDHHATAMADLKDVPGTFFDTSRSGAMLAWEFFHPDKPAPKLIQYIQDRDLWNWKLPQSKAFSAGIEAVDLNFASFEKLASDKDIEALIAKGEVILEYKNSVINQAVRRAAERLWILPDRTYTSKVVNSNVAVSEIGHMLSMECDVGVVWTYDHKSRQSSVSLRSNSNDVDVSAIAQRFGGGGHKHAAAFRWQGDIEQIFLQPTRGTSSAK